MTTRLEIAREALLEIAAHDPHVAVYRCSCWKRAEQALAAIDAAPQEIVLTREEAELCVEALDEFADFEKSWVADHGQHGETAKRLSGTETLIAKLRAALDAGREETK